MFSKVVASLALVSLVRAAQLAVTVGGPNILKFDPDFVTANPGDTIIFTFKQKNHTVTQSTLANPCQQAEGGFDSGFVPVADNNTEGPFPTAEFTVQDTNPVWVYCRQANHCQQGMVFAVNPGNNLAAFQAAATGNSSTTTTSSTSSNSTTATSSSTAASSSATSSDHLVVVGGPNQLTYSPSNISAQAGDTITFQFHEKNHTVTQSSFADPCRALTLTSTSGQTGFDSGFMAVASNVTNFPTYTIQVNDTSPIWVYCKQTGHCGQGMVFSANAVESGPNNFAAFQAKAKQLNGTSTSSTSSSTISKSDATVRRNVGVAMVMVGVAFGLVL